ncbi:MAG: sigma-54-dependent transcriptional regulator, partial [Alphaproteobacteria bacterium]
MLNSVLIVDDDPAESQHLCKILEPLGHKPVSVESGGQALDCLDGPLPFSAVILDLVMPDMDGMTVLQRLAARPASAPPVIVQVTENGIGAAGSALRAGAVDFLVKPATAERVRAALTNAMRISRLERELIRIGRRRAGTATLRDLAASSPVMERAISLAERASRSNIPVLVEGEPGVGKEQLARAIHNASPRRARQFIVADSASGNAGVAPVPSVSELLEQARGGTLYLDNAGRLSEGDQEALLRHMDQAADRAVNTGRPGRSGVRIIAASDYRLIDLVSAGQFREDLFYRLNVLPIWLPPLRERRADLPELANRCLTWFAAEQGKAQIY